MTATTNKGGFDTFVQVHVKPDRLNTVSFRDNLTDNPVGAFAVNGISTFITVKINYLLWNILYREQAP
jgi:hypothetical protein